MQKTAYEMRISDWSSDVCSSDLLPRRHRAGLPTDNSRHLDLPLRERHDDSVGGGLSLRADHHPGLGGGAEHGRCRRRSEEHTSELQSLMRISYAVFCLKKKRQEQHKHHTINQ